MLLALVPNGERSLGEAMRNQDGQPLNDGMAKGPDLVPRHLRPGAEPAGRSE